MTEIALPDPQQYTLAHLPEFLEQCALVRTKCEKDKDLRTANELKRRVDAFAHYMADKEARDRLRAERVLIEQLIGRLIGPAEMGRPKRLHDVTFSDPDPDPDLSLVVDASDFTKRDRNYFRTLAANEDLVEELVESGITSRAAILRAIAGELSDEPSAETERAENGDRPLRDGEFRCPHCKRPVTLDSLLTE